MELLNEPNPAITKNLFLSSLKKHKEPIKIKIVNVGSIFKSKMSNKPNLFIDILILNHWFCYFQIYNVCHFLCGNIQLYIFLI